MELLDSDYLEDMFPLHYIRDSCSSNIQLNFSVLPVAKGYRSGVKYAPSCLGCG